MVTRNSPGSIYLVPVPIGNLGDITLRGLEILKSVELIAAEDTRKTRFLLSQYQISIPKLLSFHKFNERSRLDTLFEHLEKGKDLAVVSDAGSPGISDPAMDLVAEAIAKGYRVMALPGASALLPAISASGLNRGPFVFLGFLPLKGKARQEALMQIRDSRFPVVVYEAPHRIEALIKELYELCGKRKVCLAREISKLYEEYIRGDLEQLSQQGSFTLKGEFVMVIDANEAPERPNTDAEGLARLLLEDKVKPQTVSKALQQSCGLKRNEAYELVLKIRTDLEAEG